MNDAKFFSVDGDGNIILIKYDKSWSQPSDIIVPFDTPPSGINESKLLCYNRSAGKGVFYSCDVEGNITLLNTYNGWRKSWFKIIAGRFAQATLPRQSILLYDNSLKLKIHAFKCADSDGGREAQITPDEVQQWVTFANMVYADAGILIDFNPNSDFQTLNNTTTNNLGAEQATKDAAANKAAEFPDKIVVFFRHRPGSKPTGGSASSIMSNLIAMSGFSIATLNGYYKDGTVKNNIQSIKRFAHELGHYLGIGHTHVDITYDGFSDPHDAVVAYLKDKNKKNSICIGWRLIIIHRL